MDCCFRIQYSWKRKDGMVDSFSSMSWFQRGGGPYARIPVPLAWRKTMPCDFFLRTEQANGRCLVCHIQRDLNIWERVPMQHIQWPVSVASAWEDSQSQVYMLLSATAHCGHWPASDIKPRLRGIRIFLMSSWQIYPPFLSYHQRPGSHIKKNWKHMI